jgi:hypothetical protein
MQMKRAKHKVARYRRERSANEMRKRCPSQARQTFLGRHFATHSHAAPAVQRYLPPHSPDRWDRRPLPAILSFPSTIADLQPDLIEIPAFLRSSGPLAS